MFKLLLSNKQAQAASEADAAAQAQAQSALQQQLASAQAQALLLEGRLVDRQVSKYNDLSCAATCFDREVR